MKSLLYHAFGVKGFRYLRTRYEGGEIIFEVEPEEGARSARRAEAATARVSLAHGTQRVHRAQAGGAQGQGAAVVKHHDGRGI